MATVSAFIRSTKKNSKCKVRFRIRDGRNVQLFYTSDLEILPTHWDAKRQEIKAKVNYSTEDRIEFNEKVARWKTLLLKAYDSLVEKESIVPEIFYMHVQRVLHPEDFIDNENDFWGICDEFLQKRKLSPRRKAMYKSFFRTLKRFEIWRQQNNSNYHLELDRISVDDLYVFDNYLRNEHTIAVALPDIYIRVPKSSRPKPKGPNAIIDILGKFRTFFNWTNSTGKTKNNPFHSFKLDECVYGTPFFLSIEERNRLYRTNLSRHPEIAVQRDIFVFQCLIGCRVGDLFSFTKTNIINGAVEYIQRKTKDGRPVTLRVPLTTIANEIIERYQNTDPIKLLPFTSTKAYNNAIKQAFKAARLTRYVTILNPLTREAEQVRICDKATSHMARRIFTGNLYKKIKDPNLIGALDGHVEGSKAFARYRTIDEDMKKEVVNMLD